MSTVKQIALKITKITTGIIFATFAGGFIISSALPNVVMADDSCNSGLLGFPAWYRGLTNEDCSIKSPSSFGSNGVQTFILIMAINVIEAAMVLAAYVTAGFLIYGGFLFLTSGGSPEGSAKARKTLLDAAIGLAIVLAAVALVQFVSYSVIGS